MNFYQQFWILEENGDALFSDNIAANRGPKGACFKAAEDLFIATVDKALTRECCNQYCADNFPSIQIYNTLEYFGLGKKEIDGVLQFA